MTSPVQEIKDRLDIVEFIRSYVPLLPAGKNFKANCPFHKEKTPSFMVSPERQTWHCFGSCSEGGDIFKFLMKYENLEFYEVLKILAEKAGIELRQIAPAEQKQFNVLYEINEEAKEFFKKNLEGSVEAKKYLLDRGLKKETIEEFELGFSSNKWEELSLYLIKKKYSAFDIERAGLAYKNERGSLIDRFRGRIMFPIHNHFGKVIGFSGRILPELDAGEAGKYINSPETLIFNKSKILYGFHKSKNFIRSAPISQASHFAGVRTEIPWKEFFVLEIHIYRIKEIFSIKVSTYRNFNACHEFLKLKFFDLFRPCHLIVLKHLYNIFSVFLFSQKHHILKGVRRRPS